MAEIIKLPEVDLQLDYPLMKALQERRTVRKWQNKPLSDQDIANLLWSACGITKEAKGKAKSKRTAPSACNSQEIKVYILKEDGAFLYDEVEHALIRITEEDIREYIGTQKMMKSAAAGLVLVADLSRMSSPVLKKEEAQKFSAWVDTGYVSQNIYLYCAAANMATAALALVKRDVLSKKLGLKEHEKIVITHAVGYRQ